MVSLLDRECSIQRRHQKVIEEAPSAWLSAELREKMSATAVSIGNLLSYESAGTVEFIIDVDTAEFFFLEVNTRIQVEHPITEETTGLDVVALQLYVASGGRLGDLDNFENGRAPQRGHAIECRLCAEDPIRDFLPDLGTILRWTPASERPNRHNIMEFDTQQAFATRIKSWADQTMSCFSRGRRQGHL